MQKFKTFFPNSLVSRHIAVATSPLMQTTLQFGIIIVFIKVAYLVNQHFFYDCVITKYTIIVKDPRYKQHTV